MTAEERATRLVYWLLRAHTHMVEDPRTWSKDNAAKGQFYGLVNKVTRLVAAALEKGA